MVRGQDFLVAGPSLRVRGELTSKKRLVRIVCLIMLVAPVPAQKQPSQTRPPRKGTPPEVTRTVEAIQGTWAGSMIASVPGYPSETFEWTMDCRFVALGAGASCTNKGKASIGNMAESCLLAFDPEGKAVHYMCVTSMGEVHDHKGQW